MVDEQKEIIYGKVIQSLSLSNQPSYHGAVVWSKDDRIAVVTDQSINVLTLLFSEDNIKTNLKFYLSAIPAKTEQRFSTAVKGGLELCDIDKAISVGDEVITRRLLNLTSRSPRNTGVNLNAFKCVAWSPCGCDTYGRCILATLCLGHRLSLHMSNKLNKSWTEAACVSDKWREHCKKVYLPVVRKKLQVIRKTNYKRLVTAEVISSMCSTEMDYTVNVYFTGLDWCPVLMDFNGHDDSVSRQQFAVLAAVTCSGKITFWKVAVPLMCDSAEVELMAGDVQCSVAQPCSLAWYSNDQHKGLIAVGGADGQIEVINVVISTNSELKIAITSSSRHMIWNDADDIAVNWLSWYTSMSKEQSAVLVATKGSAVVQFPVILGEDRTLQETTHSVHDGGHLSFVCGMGVAHDGRVFTCDTDSSVRLIETGNKDSSLIQYDAKPGFSRCGLAVSPNGLYIALLHTRATHRQQNRAAFKQIEVSIVSLVSEEFLSKAISRLGRCSLWDIQTAVHQYYTQNDPPKDGPVTEFVDTPLEELPLFSLYVRHRLTEQIAKHSDESFTMDDNTMEIPDDRDWKLEARESGRHIVKILLTASLTSKLQNYHDNGLTMKERLTLLLMSDWLVMNYSDQGTLDLAFNIYNIAGDTASISVATKIQQQGIMGKIMDPLTCGIPDGESVHDSNEDQPPCKLKKTEYDHQDCNSTSDMVSLPCREKCQICNSDIPLVSLTSGQCTRGHEWKRCGVTFCVCPDYLGHRCQDCGSFISLIGEEKSPWLQELFQRSRVCSLCYGWLDSRE